MPSGPPLISILTILGIAGLAVLPGGWPTAVILIACCFSISTLGTAWIREASQRAKHRATLLAMADERKAQTDREPTK